VRARIESLRSELTCVTPGRPLSPDYRSPLIASRPHHCRQTATVPITISRRGICSASVREQEDGKAGYAPALLHKWEPDACSSGGSAATARIRILSLVATSFSSKSAGRHVMGVYPLLEEEDCWFLAVDFDKGGWKDDVTAFAETCDLSAFRSFESTLSQWGHVGAAISARARQSGARTHLERNADRSAGFGNAVTVVFTHPCRSRLRETNRSPLRGWVDRP